MRKITEALEQLELTRRKRFAHWFKQRYGREPTLRNENLFDAYVAGGKQDRVDQLISKFRKQ